MKRLIKFQFFIKHFIQQKYYSNIRAIIFKLVN